VSKKQQRQRFLERLERPEKNWKFSFGDLEERKHWSEYRQAFEQMVQNTSTKWAPSWAIPADHQWVTLVAAIITRSVDGLGVGFRKVSEKDRLRLVAARTDFGQTTDRGDC
jgi:polyphosphate kinase 2 (PPK2 family)